MSLLLALAMLQSVYESTQLDLEACVLLLLLLLLPLVQGRFHRFTR
jgi:hypothetical protein